MTEFQHSEDDWVLVLGEILETRSASANAEMLSDILGGCSASFTSSASHLFHEYLLSGLLCTGTILGYSCESRRYSPCTRKPAIAGGALSVTGMHYVWQSPLHQWPNLSSNNLPLGGKTPSLMIPASLLPDTFSMCPSVSLWVLHLWRMPLSSPSFHLELRFSHHWTSLKPQHVGTYLCQGSHLPSRQCLFRGVEAGDDTRVFPGRKSSSDLSCLETLPCVLASWGVSLCN